MKYRLRVLFEGVKDYIKNCEKCKINKKLTNTKETLVVTDTPIKAFDTVQIDTVGPLPTTSFDNKYLLSAQCELTKYIVLIPMKDKNSLTIAKALINDIILKYGQMRILKSDRGSELCNQIIDNICETLKVERKISTPYHHETIGGLERNHRELNAYLRSFVNEELNDWDDWSQYFAFAYNTTPNSYHSYTPYELLFGVKHTDLRELSKDISPIYNVDDYAKVVKYHLQFSLQRAKTYLEQYKSKRQLFSTHKNNPLELKVNDKIYLKNEARHKLEPFYKGPYTITNILENNNIEIDYKNKKLIVHKNNVII